MINKIHLITKSLPELNLPRIQSSNDQEQKLLLKFAKALQREEKLNNARERIIGKNFNFNGYGIADLVMVEFKRNKDKLTYKILTTFELKLSDWRRAIKQAYRYKYYSNKAIVVMPIKRRESYESKKQIFKKLEVGLWLFDSRTNNIIKIYTPRLKKPTHKSAYSKAMKIIDTKFKPLLNA